MTAEIIALFGCGRGGNLDIWNCSRTLSYVRAHSPSASRVMNACCPDVASSFPESVSGPYTNPIDDDAWWYDASRPESASFFGLQVTKVTGMDKDTIDLQTKPTQSCDNRVLHSPTVYKGSVITVEGVLHGLTCCAVAYGLRALRKQLLGCCNDDQCGGTRLRFISCLSSGDDIPACGSWIPPEEWTDPWRTIMNVRVAELPSVTDGSGASCGACGCKPMTRVMFTLRADSNLYHEPQAILATNLRSPGSDCELACPDAECEENLFMTDPLCPQPILVPPSDASLSCFCPPILRQQQCFTVDLGTKMFDSDIEITVYSGSTELRNLEVRIWREIAGLDFDPLLYTRCNACTGFTISYVPAATTLIRDMCGVRALQGTKRAPAASVFAGIGGRFSDGCVQLACGRYIICVYADLTNTASDATIILAGREFEP